MSIETVSDIAILSSDTEEHDATGFAWKAPETYLRGTVNITLQRPKVLKTLQVDLVRRQRARTDQPLTDIYKVCRQTVVIEGVTSAYGIRQSSSMVSTQPRLLEAGSYRYMVLPQAGRSILIASVQFPVRTDCVARCGSVGEDTLRSNNLQAGRFGRWSWQNRDKYSRRS